MPRPRSVVALAGRRIDAAGTAARFPLRLRTRVGELIREALTGIDAQGLVSSAACGADLLALDAAGALGIRRRVILPFDVAAFRTHSVIDRPGEWGPLFDRIVSEIENAGDLVRLALPAANRSAYRLANRAILAEGDRLCTQRGAAVRIAMIVWEGHSRGTNDLTEDFRRQAVAGGWRTCEILTLTESL